jgi:hypothetical protein
MKVAVHLVYSSNLKMEAIHPSETLITIYHTLQHKIPAVYIEPMRR